MRAVIRPVEGSKPLSNSGGEEAFLEGLGSLNLSPVKLEASSQDVDPSLNEVIHLQSCFHEGHVLTLGLPILKALTFAMNFEVNNSHQATCVPMIHAAS